jgi:hypothetical protein
MKAFIHPDHYIPNVDDIVLYLDLGIRLDLGNLLVYDYTRS